MNNFEERKKSDLQLYAGKWLSNIKPNVFLTFSFGYPTSYTDAEKIFGKFLYGVKCYLWGRNSKKRIPMAPIVEKYQENGLSNVLSMKAEGIHIHCVMNLPGNPIEHRSKLKDLWVNTDKRCGNPDIYCPSSNDWYREIQTEEDQKKAIDYALKTCITDTEAILMRYVSLKPLI